MKKILVCIVIIPICHLLMAQDTKEWATVKVGEECSFVIPPSMEVQGGKYKEYAEGMRKILKIVESNVIIQPIGLNNFKKPNKYARILFNTEIGSAGDFNNLNTDYSSITTEELSELNDLLRKEAEYSMANNLIPMTIKLVKWYPVKIEKLNNMSCVHTNYVRQLGDDSPVLVHEYKFFNNDRMHVFTLSHRVSDETYWKAGFSKVLNSLKIRKR